MSDASQFDEYVRQFEQALRKTKNLRVERWVAQTPTESEDAMIELLHAEYRIRSMRGEPCEISEFMERFPNLGERLRRVLQLEEMLREDEASESEEDFEGLRSQDQSPSIECLPASFGRFTLTRCLGEGGMGAVYLAEDSQLDRQVAIKIPFFQSADRGSVIARFQREARAAAGLRDPHICPVYEVGTVGDVPFIAMAYIEGESLASVLKSEEQWPLRKRVFVVHQLAVTLQKSHEHGVMHRDLKPSNVMIDTRGNPIVMDFGLARRRDSDDSTLTKSGQMIGTVAYAAPEQIGGTENVTNQSDIYSLGVILYQMVAGRLPFEGDLLQILSQVAHDTAQPPSKFRSEVDPGLDAICLKAIARNVSDRYQTMAEFAEEITSWLESSSDVQSGEGTRGRREIRSAKRPAIVAGGVLLLGITATFLSQNAGLVFGPGRASQAVSIGSSTQGELSADVAVRVWGENKKGIPIDDVDALPLRNGDQVRFDVTLSRPAFVYILWVDAAGNASEIYPNDPERGFQGMEPQLEVNSPQTPTSGWPVVGSSGIESAFVLIREHPISPELDLPSLVSLPPARAFHSDRQLMTVQTTGIGNASKQPGVVQEVSDRFRSSHRGLGEQSQPLDDPSMVVFDKLVSEFELAKIVRVAHVGE